MCSTRFNDGTVKWQRLLPAPFTKHRTVCPILLQMRSNIRLWNVPKDLSQISLLCQAIFLLWWLAIGFCSFFSKQTVYLQSVGCEGLSTAKKKKTNMRLWLREKLKSSVVLKGKWFKRIVFPLWTAPSCTGSICFLCPYLKCDQFIFSLYSIWKECSISCFFV